MLRVSAKSPCLWALVWPSKPCFIPNLCVKKWAKLLTGYQFGRFQNLILTRLDSVKPRHCQGTGNANTELGMKLLRGPIEVRKLIWSLVFPACCFLPVFSFCPHFLVSWGSVPPVWDTKLITQCCCRLCKGKLKDWMGLVSLWMDIGFTKFSNIVLKASQTIIIFTIGILILAFSIMKIMLLSYYCNSD